MNQRGGPEAQEGAPGAVSNSSHLPASPEDSASPDQVTFREIYGDSSTYSFPEGALMRATGSTLGSVLDTVASLGKLESRRDWRVLAELPSEELYVLRDAEEGLAGRLPVKFGEAEFPSWLSG